MRGAGRRRCRRSPRSSAAARSSGRRSPRSARGCGRRGTTRTTRRWRSRRASRAFATDACVPISRLADCVLETRPTSTRAGSSRRSSATSATATSTSSCCSTPTMPDERARAEALAKRVSLRAIAMGGTCTGEHGIGMHKLDALVAEHGEAVELMRTIKRALDPRQHHESRQDRPALTTPAMYTLYRRQQELLVVVAARLARDEAVAARRSREVAGVARRPRRRTRPTAAFSPTGRVPCLHDGDVVVWDSLAIAEYLAERHPGHVAGRSASRARGRARSARRCTRASRRCATR